MNLMEFTDGGSVTNFVAKKSIYKSKEDFLHDCLNEFDYILEDYLSDSECEKMKSFTDTSIVEDGVYCRYYPRLPDAFGYLDMESGYTFCPKGRGAFEVYSIDFENLLKVFSLQKNNHNEKR